MKKCLPLLLLILAACSKSNNTKTPTGSGYNNATGLLPLAVGNQWNYKQVTYNPTTGAFIDSSHFTLTVTGTSTNAGVTYYQLVNSSDNSVLWLTNLSATSLGSIDSVGGVSYYTTFINGTGDSTQPTSTWPAMAANCTGTEKLFAYYADTTLTDLNGTVYTDAIKNDAVIYDCSGNKYRSQVYFVKAGVGLVRYVLYVYTAGGDREEESYWVLLSSTVSN
jgi:hypothetical protein